MRILPNVRGALRLSALLGATLLCAAHAEAGTFSTAPLNNDADSGILGSKTYTHAIDVNGEADVTVNGQVFTARTAVTNAGSATEGDGAFAMTGFGSPNSSANTAVTGSIAGMLNDFRYGLDESTLAGTRVATVTLTGLTPNQAYLATFYQVTWDPATPGLRAISVSASGGDVGGPFAFTEDTASDGQGSLLRYSYTPTSGSMTFTFDPADEGHTYHMYAFSNEVVPEPATAGLLAVGALGLLGRRRRR